MKSSELDFTIDRFPGVPDVADIEPIATIVDMASDFRETVEPAWSKRTAHPSAQEAAGPYMAEGQCAVTMHLFRSILEEQCPGIDARNMIGDVFDRGGKPYTTNHVWTEVETVGGRTLIVDLTPDQNDDPDDLTPKMLIGFSDELEQKGYVYSPREIDESPDSNPNLGPRYEILRQRYQRVQTRRSYYDQLAKQNIYIVGGVATGKSELAKNLETTFPHKFVVDVGNLFRVITKSILEATEGSKHYISGELVEQVLGGDVDATDSFIGLLSRKTSSLRQTLAEIDIVEQDGLRRMTRNGEDVESGIETAEIESLVPLVAGVQSVRRVVWDWIDKNASEKDGLILTGHSLTDIDTTKFTVIPLRASPDVVAKRALERTRSPGTSLHVASERIKNRNQNDRLFITDGILDYLGIEAIETDGLTQRGVALAALLRFARAAKNSVEIQALQAEISVPRAEFQWGVNGLVSGIRTVGQEIFESIVADERLIDPENTPTEFDLSVQTMIQLCGYEADRIWLGDASIVADSVALINDGKGDEANQLLSKALQSGDIYLNTELVREIALGQIQRIKEFTAAHYNNEFYLPKFADPKTSPFDHPNPEVTSKGREIVTLDNGEREIVIHERYSGKRIVLKRTQPEISKAYAKGLHYLHVGRDDEYKAYGAYLEGEQFPFAWVSYSPVDRSYKKEMLQFFGVEPHRMLEMTRAWNASWSPKNSMSLLFSFAHSELQEDFQRGVDRKERDKPLAGILTAINPNLGFRANAFNGVDFGIIGLKPAGFTYFVDESGETSYMSRRAIAKKLGVPESELESDPRFTRNKVPLLPTNEMAVFFRGTKRYQLPGPIYRIPDNAYVESKS